MKRHLVENDITKMKSLISYNIGETITEQEEKSRRDLGKPFNPCKPIS